MYRSAGDPGFLGNLFRGVTRTVGGAIGGFLKGGPAGAIGGALGGAVSATRANIAASGITGAGDDPRGDAARLARVKAHHAAALAHHATAAIGGSQAGHPVMMIGPGLGGGGVGGFGGRRRRMRWANTKALGRAERRIASAVKHMTKYIRWVHPTKQGHAAPKFHRRKK